MIASQKSNRLEEGASTLPGAGHWLPPSTTSGGWSQGGGACPAVTDKPDGESRYGNYEDRTLFPRKKRPV